MPPKIIIIAGPNGAGKTTFAREFLPREAVQRVAERVRQGGHNIPEPTIRRRFEAGRRLLAEVYQSLVDQWVVYDNAGDEPVLVDWSEKQ